MNEFIFSLRAYIEDVDNSAMVYHANYLKFFERARSEWVEKIGFGIHAQRAEGIYFLVRYANVDYLKSAKLHQHLEVVSRISEIRKASIVFDQRLRLTERPDTILCKAEIKIACVDQNLRPRSLPGLLIDILNGEQV